ncbi:T9SS type B sorting domain-containing protein [Maribacter sp. SA7]|uniref:T9SS type B sorting domain-containing protein n=1 Tax=Maribacter zhoushanensis TaxID=3030012 RepID=UPI0023EB9E14|nr:T9SS type B sorting domain-containing protein [Maribacter zhoushanensis]MDF4202412.1 T9SS type B sorting domain-containing protein [Maribacter zhoushanensis]
MKKKWDYRIPQILAAPIFFIVLLFAVFKTSAQECPALVSPINGATLVSVDASISWEAITGVPGYIISLGTSPGGNDILNERNVGALTSYTSPAGLPESTEIFITITLFFFNQPNIVCESQSFTTAALSEAPQCVPSTFPANDALDINTATNISWNAAPNATGYFLSIGTTLNGSEILTSTDLGNSLNYNTPTDLPPEAEIFITIIPYNRIGIAAGCSTVMFTTAPEAVLPICTTMISPVNGETNVPLSPTLEWNAVTNATGYRVSIGTSPFETNILEDAIFFKTSTVIIDFEPNRTFFISIYPFNEAGEAIGCTQETFSTLVGCGPYFDPVSGELLVLNPELSFPDSVSICTDNEFNVITATDEADGYRWYKLDERGNETLLSTTAEVSIDEEGKYIHEAYVNIEESGRTFECSSSKMFEVKISQIPEIADVKVQITANSLNYEIFTTTTGNYEYAIDNKEGPYQDTNRFTNLSLQNHTIYVRDKDGCGLATKFVEQDLTVNGFPNFFTPNGDGDNDYWQYIPPVENTEPIIEVIYIFNQFGSLIQQLSPTSIGWDGTFNNQEMPETDYWYKASFVNQQPITGHFSLKR